MVLTSEAKAIRANNWTRGSIFTSNGSNSYFTREENVLPHGDYMLISQLCDISTPSLEDEPYVELIQLNYIEAVDPGFTKAKSHKKLHIAIETQKCVELRAMDRFIIKREMLTSQLPLSVTTPKVADAIVSWVTKKMLRSPFPDNFNSRINRGKMKKILEKSHDCVKYFMIRLHTEEELSKEEPYKIAIMLIIEVDVSAEDLSKVRKMLDRIVELMSEHADIVVVSDDIETHDMVTLSEFTEYKEFYFDDLSWS